LGVLLFEMTMFLPNYGLWMIDGGRKRGRKLSILIISALAVTIFYAYFQIMIISDSKSFRDVAVDIQNRNESRPRSRSQPQPGMENEKIRVEKLWTNEPSHLMICRTILNLLQQQDDILTDQREDDNRSRYHVIEEDAFMIDDPNIPFTRTILQTFASSYITRQASNVHGLPIQYIHGGLDLNTPPIKKQHPTTTARNSIPSIRDSTFARILDPYTLSNDHDNENDGILTKNELIHLCNDAIQMGNLQQYSHKDNHHHGEQKIASSSISMYLHYAHTPEAFMLLQIRDTNQSDEKNRNQLPTLMKRALPFMLSNLAKSIDNYKFKLYTEDRQRHFSTTADNKYQDPNKPVADYFNSRVFHPISPAFPTLLDNKQKTHEPKGPRWDIIEKMEDTVTIYIPCIDRDCLDIYYIPIHNYFSHVPSSTKHLNILVHQGCMDNFPSVCTLLTQNFIHFFRKALPRSKVELHTEMPASIQVAILLLESKIVIYGPITTTATEQHLKKHIYSESFFHGYKIGSSSSSSIWLSDFMPCFFPTMERLWSAFSSGRSDVHTFQLFSGIIEFNVAEVVRPFSLSSIQLISLLHTHHLDNLIHLFLPIQEELIPTKHCYSIAHLQVEELEATLFPIPMDLHGKCRFVRGRIGSWLEDPVYAEVAQYKDKLRHYSGNSDTLFKRAAKQGLTGNLMFRPSTTYRWVDQYFDKKHDSNFTESMEVENQQGCDTHLLTLAKFCNVLEVGNVGRILFIGDSLGLQQAQSLWKLLGLPDQPTELFTLEPNFRHVVQCPPKVKQASPNTSQFFIFQFIRNDLLVEADGPVSIDDNIKNCGNTFCYPWFESYTQQPPEFTGSDRKRTIVIANLGLHIFNDLRSFEEKFDSFLQSLDRWNSFNGARQKSDNDMYRRMNGDIVFFRTSAPGHWGCDEPGLRPYKDYHEYYEFVSSDDKSQVDQYGWNNLFEYNDYAIKSIYERSHKSRMYDPLFQSSKDSLSSLLVEILDITPMTILRRDGHIGDEYKSPLIPGGDCLHYALPGPIDWWNHLLYNNLRDLFSMFPL